MLRTKQSFSGSFDAQCQFKSVPGSLLALVAMILYGPNITKQYDHESIPQPALTISQLLMYNSLYQKKTATTCRHSTEHEPPLPVYLGIMIHTKTRKRSVVDTLFNLELCVSYDRVLDISTALGNTVCHNYEMQAAICPPNLKAGLFSTSAIDNIDHNPPVLPVHMIPFMELGYLSFNILMIQTLESSEVLLPIQMISQETLRESLLIFQLPIIMCHLLPSLGKFFQYQSLKDTM